MPSANKDNKSSSIRIIGGKWRGRKLRFATAADLRPTPGRSRETLFNWLRPYIHNTRCVDAFAGSGSLGFEALSQGSTHCTFIEKSAKSCRMLRNNVSQLDALSQCTILQASATKLLAELEVDICFLDPPFRQSTLLEQSLSLALKNPNLKWIWVEAPHTSTIETIFAASMAADNITLSSHWDIHRQTKAGDSAGVLLQKQF